MKNQLILLGLAATLTTSALAQTKSANPGKPYVVKGQIKGLTNGKIYFSVPEGTDVRKDSLVSTNGQFMFKGVMPYADICWLWTEENKYESIPVFMDGGTVTVIAKKDSLVKATIAGSPLALLYKAHRMELEQQVFANYRAIAKKYETLKGGPKAKMPDSLAKLQTVEIRHQDFRADSLTRLFIANHTNSTISPYLALKYYGYEPEAVKLPAIYASLTPEVKNSYQGMRLKEFLSNLEKIGLGRTAPNFTLADTTGKSVSLSSIKGKYILVDFWASWCGPCRKENPNVVSAYKKFHDKGFEIVGVSLDTKKNAWEKAINADGLSWYHVSDLKGWKSSILEPYVVKSVPTSFLLDQNGKIIAKNLRGEQLDKKLAELLNTKP